MKLEDIPNYIDSSSFEELGDLAKYPCHTQFMRYNPLLRRYVLTEEALSHYGIDFSELSATEIPLFLEKVSKKVYDYIHYKAGLSCFRIMQYRIAAAPTSIYPDRYTMRKQFEEALAEEARWLITNSDSARFSDKEKKDPKPPEADFMDTSDVAMETKRTLDALRLTRWFQTVNMIRLDESKF